MTKEKKILPVQPAVAKPFLKWAGGKGQLISAIQEALPEDFGGQNNFTYIEPFIGSGAVLFWLLPLYPGVKKVVVNDVNPDLVKAYITVKQQPTDLIKLLQAIEGEYVALASEEDKKSFYLEKRELFNNRFSDSVKHTALLFFLNKTCFNGLYRVNSQNKFNVPFGRYNKPKICDVETILADSNLLQRVIILNGDYSDTYKYATKNSFFYIDPPYRPLNKTSSFTAYSKDSFTDDDQFKLKQFCDRLSGKGYKWLLSNSYTPDNFFENLYSGQSFYIKKVKARRSINSVASGRGEITELLISNYPR